MVESVDHLVEVRVMLPDMRVVEVDVVGAQPLQRRIDGGEQVLAGVAASRRGGTHGIAALGCDDHILPPHEVLHRAADNLLAASH